MIVDDLILWTYVQLPLGKNMGRTLQPEPNMLMDFEKQSL